MNHIFSPYLGRFLDVYLDDIIIYSNSLSKAKIRFLASELKLLGRIVDDEGIRMDPDKVNSVMNWKVPNVRIPLGVLSAITGDKVPFRWTYAEQRAFDEVKRLAEETRNHHRTPIRYGEGSPPVWLVTDGCATGIAGLISQGSEWKTAKIAAFYSAKLNSAQRNYPVHEIEMLAGIETMLRYKDILVNQKSLSGRQARWMEKISSFIFEVVYVAGIENVVADALSRITMSRMRIRHRWMTG